MNKHDDAKLKSLLRQCWTPMNAELQRDLWPRMQRRLDEQRASGTWFSALFSPTRLTAVPWFDWAMLAALVLGVCFFPRSIPIWLYHL